MRIVDMHCDTISVLLHKENKNENISLLNNDLSIDLLKMKKGDYLLQNFACFVHRESTPSPELKAMQLIDLYYRLMEENKVFYTAKNDKVFKKIMADEDNKEMLIKFLERILNKKIEELTY